MTKSCQALLTFKYFAELLTFRVPPLLHAVVQVVDTLGTDPYH
jgi:hypothetical protein